MTTVMVRTRPKRTQSSLPPMLAATASSALYMPTFAGSSHPAPEPVGAGSTDTPKARKATSHERSANSSKQWVP